jgi:hypothetical protein
MMAEIMALLRMQAPCSDEKVQSIPLPLPVIIFSNGKALENRHSYS